MITQPSFEHGSFQLYPLVAAVFSPRENTIISCLLNGVRPYQVHAIIGTAKRTVKSYLKAISIKMGLRKVSTLVIMVELAKCSEWQPNPVVERSAT